MRKKISISTLLLSILILPSVAHLTACSTPRTIIQDKQYTTKHYQHDSVRIHDSIHIDYRIGTTPIPLVSSAISLPSIREEPTPPPTIRVDTIYLERWHTQWRQREQIRTDTIYQQQLQTLPPERYVPTFYKGCTMLCLLLLLYHAYRLYRRYKP